jgi:chromosome segregation ATPase
MSEAVIAIQRELDKARTRIAELEGADPVNVQELREKILGLSVQKARLEEELTSLKNKWGDKDPKTLKREAEDSNRRAKSAVAEQENMRALVLQMKDQVQGMQKFVVAETAALKDLQDSLEGKFKELEEKAEGLASELVKAIRDKEQAQENLRGVLKKLKDVARLYRKRMDPPKNLEEYIAMYESDPPEPKGKVRKSRRA